MILCGASATSRTVASVITAEGALGAGQEAGDVEAVLRQQVLQAVAGDLATEAAELGPDRAQAGGDQRPQPLADRRARALAVGTEADPLAGSGHHLQRDHVVGGLAVAQGARAAGVVADHAADRAAVVGRRVGPEPQPVRGGGRPAAPPAPRRAGPGRSGPPGRWPGSRSGAGRRRRPAPARPRSRRRTYPLPGWSPAARPCGPRPAPLSSSSTVRGRATACGATRYSEASEE